jgi:predicted ribosome quality control (RQC) complex YloA/Tae2 family protein
MFSKRLKDLFANNPDHDHRDLELLKYGRHFRSGELKRIVVGRNQRDNEAMEKLVRDEDTVMFAARSPGPLVMIPGGGSEETIASAARLCLLYSDAPDNEDGIVNITRNGISSPALFSPASRSEAAAWII